MRSHCPVALSWWTFRIFLIFFCREGVGGIGFLLKIPGGGVCTWAKLGLFGFLAFFPQFYNIFWPKNGFANVKNTGFFCIPAGPSDYFSENALFGQNVNIYSIFMPQCVA